ncbi:TetR/AcrR family transcriptional regulator [Nocardioides pocheonensis]|jgi:AcrR family transcriptional regulator|uniref:TetR/AcrR family transcriptional regulator n=1 Tax=Nocardioides pocheonensis TaxID=661485 RepID=A0A3N0GP35_9ACTN|nr:TetR/AcrR family transcriptional regulator [Nocardioides pocheonensis]RNM14151.1 TetR/AcrR family transcriptional regulator [Nocardioides pocheonensis]
MTTPSTGRVRMSPESRREQLLDLGTRLLATRTLDEVSIELLAEEAGISRGLLYHYFGNKQEFHAAVVRRAVEDIYAITAPRGIEDPLEQLAVSLGAYVDYVKENYTGYVSLIRAAAGGNEELRAIYQQARRALTDRIFEIAGAEQLAELGVVDSAATRLLVDGWAALVENVVVAWVEDPAGLSRDELLQRLALVLPAIVTR